MGMSRSRTQGSIDDLAKNLIKQVFPCLTAVRLDVRQADACGLAKAIVDKPFEPVERNLKTRPERVSAGDESPPERRIRAAPRAPQRRRRRAGSSR